ncbi:hypothetical protein RHMOL_Rhmol04G0284500 [Rhododendron molle]|uniref:Uncharacterized protein n=1 Tax=Rhododendron molle TaxID=49168 RepID=A0ACC0P5Q2_RHOML|nr:hypothetical protein RHMOL_Rhmol04G0284500 [Rhododendron molle]
MDFNRLLFFEHARKIAEAENEKNPLGAEVPIQVNKNLAFTDGMRVIESAKVSMHAVMFQAQQPALHRNQAV